MAFENEDVEVEGISNGQEAFDQIAEFNPDIILADVGMPGLDGFELSAKIKEAPETSGIKVLLLASDFEDFDEQRYQACGADNYILKPFKSDDIVSMVKSLLEGSSGDGDAALLSDSETGGQPVGKTEEVAEILGNLKVPESREEPSLEELLDSVEKLSIDGRETSDLMDEELALPESVEEVTGNEALDLSSEGLMEPMKCSDFPDDPLAPEEELQVSALQSEDDDDVMGQMIRGVEELKESVQSPDPATEEAEAFPFAESDADELGYADESEIFADVGKRRMDNMDELDSAFKELAMRERPDSANHEDKPSALSSLGGIVPEPEGLLEHIVPGVFSEVGKRSATPEDIKENLDAISGFSDQDRNLSPRNFPSRNWQYESEDDRFTQAVTEEVKLVLKRSLGTSLEKEVSGLSDVILKTIREVVREVTPEIARKVIREEIEKIKEQDMY